MMSHRNGAPPALPGLRKVAPLPPARTEFLPDLPVDSWQGWLYELSRQRLLDLPLTRWISGALLALALVWGLGRLPGGWWLVAAWLLGALAFAALTRYAARQQYITFQPQPAEFPAPAPLPPDAKMPLYVTGWLSVEGRTRAFTNLPGFYRTFATREHALLCQLRPPRPLGPGALPADEPGLWYAFFTPEQISRIETGLVTAGRQRLSAVAVACSVPAAKQLRRRRLTLYLAFPDSAARQVVLADLLADQLVQSAVTRA